jgi:hypothetical protein
MDRFPLPLMPEMLISAVKSNRDLPGKLGKRFSADRQEQGCLTLAQWKSLSKITLFQGNFGGAQQGLAKLRADDRCRKEAAEGAAMDDLGAHVQAGGKWGGLW